MKSSDDYILVDGFCWLLLKNVNRREGYVRASLCGKEIMLAKIVDGYVTSIRISVHKNGKKHRGGVTHFSRIA